MASAEHDDLPLWKLSIIRGYLWVSTSSALILTLLVLKVTWDAPVPLLPGVLFGTALFDALMLRISYRLPQHWEPLGVLIALKILLTSALVMAMLPTRQVAVSSTFMLVPLVAAFLANRRWVLPITTASALTLLAASAMLDVGIENIADAMSSTVLMGMVGGLAWLVEREREQWQARSREQQAALKVAVAAAESAAEARARFLATMSHEIRTPMNGVLGLTEALVSSGLTDEQAELARTVHDSGRLLHHILNDILDLSRMEAGQMEIDPQPTELRRLVSHVASLYRERAEQGGVTLLATVDPAVPDWGLVDDARLSQLLINLVSNAVKFTAAGAVRIAVRPEGDQLCFSVTDTGVGLEGVDIETLFQPFIQADATTQRRFGGTGLGLAISARLCEQMGGTIGAEALPDGARFWFRLPIPVAAPARHADVEDCTDLRGLRILVAEDNAVNQLVIRRLLEGLGAEMVLAPDGQAALAALDASAAAPDLVLMDCHMPVMDGFEATRQIRQRPDGAVLPILALTASVTAEDRRRALAAGMDELIGKPIDRGELVRAIRYFTAPSPQPRLAQGS